MCKYLHPSPRAHFCPRWKNLQGSSIFGSFGFVRRATSWARSVPGSGLGAPDENKPNEKKKKKRTDSETLRSSTRTALDTKLVQNSIRRPTKRTIPRRRSGVYLPLLRSRLPTATKKKKKSSKQVELKKQKFPCFSCSQLVVPCRGSVGSRHWRSRHTCSLIPNFF